jgi:hypothetical protein
MKLRIILIITLTNLFAVASEARRDQNRQVRQNVRIAEGVKSGELTRPEAKKLKRGQKRIDKAQAAALKDGDVSKKEAVIIEKMQDNLSEKIYDQKHD